MRPFICHPNRSSFLFRIRHRRFSFLLLQSMLAFPEICSAILGESSGAPCTPPRSATGYSGCPRAASEPSRRIFSSDSRGHVTSTRAWSGTAIEPSATGKISCVPSILVCTSPHLPRRSSCVQNPAVTMTSSRMSACACGSRVRPRKLAILHRGPRGGHRGRRTC